MRRFRFFDRSTYLWMRDLHLYAGLLLSPFVVLFALTGIFFAHSWNPFESAEKPEPRTREGRVDVVWEGDPVALAREAIRQLDIEGEIRGIRRDVFPSSFTVRAPGREYSVRIDREAATAEVTEQVLDTGEALTFLHLSPGPHLLWMRKNWVFMSLWSWLADGVVFGILSLSGGGIYLWWNLRATRRTGSVWLALGALCFGGLALWLL